VKPNNAAAWKTAGELSEWLRQRKIKVLGNPRDKKIKFDAKRRGISKTEIEIIRKDTDLLVVLGGDGTILSSARIIGDREIPVLGINYGGLGYLTEFRIEEMFDALDEILKGKFEVDRRVMLDVQHRRGGKILNRGRALNDVVINKVVVARIIEIEASLNGLFVNSFRADGLIVSTPTGSTAYNLSAGGPIVYPSMNAVVITPICPFTLTNRPIVVPDHAEIALEIKNKSEGVALTLDGQVAYEMKTNDRVVIKKSKTTFNLVQPPNRNYFDVLRNKLKWGR